jgi:hypothetical protein
MNPKKYAIALCGDLRTYKKSATHLKKNLLDINDVDVFISTNRNSSLSSNTPKLDIDNIIFENVYGEHFKEISYIEDVDLSNFIEIVKKKFKLVDPELYIKYTLEINNITNYDTWKQFYSKIFNECKKGYYLKNRQGLEYLLHELFMIYHRINALNMIEIYALKNNVEYDGIIIYRPDLFFIVPLNLSLMPINNHIYHKIDFFLILSFTQGRDFFNKLLEIYYTQEHIGIIERHFEYIIMDKYVSSLGFDICEHLLHFRPMHNNPKDMCLNFELQIIDYYVNQNDMKPYIELYSKKFYDDLKKITQELE